MRLMYVNLKYNLMKDAEKDLQKKELTALLDDLKYKILNCLSFLNYNSAFGK